VKQLREALDGKNAETALNPILAQLAVVDKPLDVAREARCPGPPASPVLLSKA